jgi:hypothetical protein
MIARRRQLDFAHLFEESAVFYRMHGEEQSSVARSPTDTWVLKSGLRRPYETTVQITTQLIFNAEGLFLVVRALKDM